MVNEPRRINRFDDQFRVGGLVAAVAGQRKFGVFILFRTVFSVDFQWILVAVIAA